VNLANAGKMSMDKTCAGRRGGARKNNPPAAHSSFAPRPECARIGGRWKSLRANVLVQALLFNDGLIFYAHAIRAACGINYLFFGLWVE
jgi:hypothetical protein